MLRALLASQQQGDVRGQCTGARAIAGVQAHPTLRVKHIAARRMVERVAARRLARHLLEKDLEVLGQRGQLLGLVVEVAPDDDLVKYSAARVNTCGLSFSRPSAELQVLHSRPRTAPVA